jgi:type III pantothenate kinase
VLRSRPGAVSNLEPTPFGEKYVLVEHIATGGMADIVANESKKIEAVHPFLTLEGLKILFDKNR